MQISTSDTFTAGGCLSSDYMKALNSSACSAETAEGRKLF